MARAVGGAHRPTPNRQPVVFAVAGFVLGLVVATCAMSWSSLGSGSVGSCTEEELRRVAAAVMSNAEMKLQRKMSSETGAASVSSAPTTMMAPVATRNADVDGVVFADATPAATRDARTVEVPMAVSPLLAMLRFSADRLFEALIAAPTAKRGLVVEVGSFDGQQAKMAYDKGHQLLVLEPSPVNFPKVRTRLRRGIESGEGRLVLLQVAASAKNGSAMFFTNRQGSPGDHISLDGKVHEGEEVNYKPHKSYRTNVPTAPLDDVVGQRRVYFLKVDVQGHELFVFEGAQRMFRERRVGYALFEFQPKQLGPNAASLIERLNGYGYDTFSLMPWWSRGEGFSDEFYSFPTDPRAFAAAFRPTHANGMGEWTDILAVCRTCVSDNHASQSRFMQRFDPDVLSAFADKVTSDGGGGARSPSEDTPIPQPPDLPPRKRPAKPPQLPVDEADFTPRPVPENPQDLKSQAPPKRPINAPIPHISSVGGYAESPTPGPPGSQVSGPKPGRAALPLPMRRPGFVPGKAGGAGVVVRRRTPLPSPQGTGADAPAAPLPAADDGDPELPPATDEPTSTEAPTTTTPPTTFAVQPAETQPDTAND